MKSANSQEANHWIYNYIIAVQGALYKPTRNWLPNYIMSVILVCGPVSQWIRVSKETDRYQKFYPDWEAGNLQTSWELADKVGTCRQVGIIGKWSLPIGNESL